MRRGVPERRRAGATGARKQESRAAPSSCRGPPLAASGGPSARVYVRCLWQTIDKQPSAVLYGPLFLPSKPRDWEGARRACRCLARFAAGFAALKVPPGARGLSEPTVSCDARRPARATWHSRRQENTA